MNGKDKFKCPFCEGLQSYVIEDYFTAKQLQVAYCFTHDTCGSCGEVFKLIKTGDKFEVKMA